MASNLLPRLPAAGTFFFLCDIQPAFKASIRSFPVLVNVAKRMIEASKLLEVPVLATQQYPKGLGPLVEELQDPGIKVLDKLSFSMLTPEVDAVLRAEEARRSVVLFGMETHVCVQQTALDLLDRGYFVYVLADGVASRTAWDRQTAIERMSRRGAIVTTSESVLFEMMGSSNHPAFKGIQKLIREPIGPLE